MRRCYQRAPPSKSLLYIRNPRSLYHWGIAPEDLPPLREHLMTSAFLALQMTANSVPFIFIRKWDIWKSEMSLIPAIELLQPNKEAVKIPSETTKINLLCLNRVVLSVCKAGICDIEDIIKSGRTYPDCVLAKIKGFTRLRHWLEERGCCP